MKRLTFEISDEMRLQLEELSQAIQKDSFGSSYEVKRALAPYTPRMQELRHRAMLRAFRTKSSSLIQDNAISFQDFPDFEVQSEGEKKSQLLLLQTEESKIIRTLSKNFDAIYGLEPRKFEFVTAELLSNQGYEVQVTPPSNDGGYDILAKLNTPLGEQVFLVECKRYGLENRVGVSIVRSLTGVVSQERTNGGVIITSSLFTRGAKIEASRTPLISLLDYEKVRDWILDYR